MVAAQVTFAVVGHHRRAQQAHRLAESLNAQLFIDDADHGANWNHLRAIKWAAGQSARVVVLEDDAQPVDGFAGLAAEWCARFPDELISFYLGTGRPPQYQQQIAESLIAADKCREDYIILNRLIHGVCYALPANGINCILLNWSQRKPADYALGDAWGRGVIYPCYSLVDHADEMPVEKAFDGLPRNERRKAWRLYR
ncbi:hypothetical protein [Cronobacter sakazakii]|uniref:hypothetical protein n=1 Tax=Cronobacter sakazakii TaxID=28141 RepID=UPI000A191348|nr:hypothetical protein [Cronobacter sakazakii]EJK9922286.1 hypothetical protein [Cronobacter sakazakii]EKF1803299.1 hypothetical protein [Cronobacter sakazakii]EKK3978331.1 hypothetical protein [Cronobacter sakazakii]EKY2076699.1 hypothetical protein [Cronobacter sakazakii]EKY2089351.1 hypothetical protein [Cronobacter sakazakii]